MTTLEQAARTALDAMMLGYSGPHTAHYWKAIDTLREALAELPTAPPEAQTEGEKTAFAFGWWQGVASAKKATLTDEENDFATKARL